MDKIDVEIQQSIGRLTSDASTSSFYFSKLRFLQANQTKLFHDEGKILAEILKIQALLTLYFAVMQKHIKIDKDLIQRNKQLSIEDKMVHLAAIL